MLNPPNKEHYLKNHGARSHKIDRNNFQPSEDAVVLRETYFVSANLPT